MPGLVLGIWVLFSSSVFGAGKQCHTFSNGNQVCIGAEEGKKTGLEFGKPKGKKQALSVVLADGAETASLLPNSELFIVRTKDSSGKVTHLAITAEGKAITLPGNTLEGKATKSDLKLKVLKDGEETYYVLSAKQNDKGTNRTVTVIRESDRKVVTLQNATTAPKFTPKIANGVLQVASSGKGAALKTSAVDSGTAARQVKLAEKVVEKKPSKAKPVTKTAKAKPVKEATPEVVEVVEAAKEEPAPPTAEAIREALEAAKEVKSPEAVAEQPAVEPLAEPLPAVEQVAEEKLEKANAKQKKRWALNRKEFQKKQAFIKNFEEVLRREFTGYDSIISQVVNRVSEIELNPGVRRPLQPIVLIGLPGIGKSLFIRRVSELLELTDATFGTTAEAGDTSVPVDVFYKAAKNSLHGKKGISGISFIDEIQRVVAPDQAIDIAKLREELKALGYREKHAPRGMGGGLESYDSYDRGFGPPPARPPAVEKEDKSHDEVDNDSDNENENEDELDDEEKEKREQKKREKAMRDRLAALEARATSTSETLEDRLAEILAERRISAGQAAKSIRVLRDATSGQGEIPGAAEKPVEELMKPIAVFLQHYAEGTAEHKDWLVEQQETIAEHRKELREILANQKKAKKADKDDFTWEIKSKKEEIEEAEGEIREKAKQVVQNAAKKSQLETALRDLLQSYPQLYDPFRDSVENELDRYMRPEKLLSRLLIADPIKTINKLKEGAKNLGPDPKIYVGNQLCFIMGNDTEYNDVLLTQKVSDANNPDLIREADMAFQNSPEGMKLKDRLAKQIFGENADWASFASRLNFPWKYLTPWGKIEWKRFAHDVLKEDARRLSAHLKEKFGADVHITYEPTVEKLLHDYGVKPVHGPRVMSNAPADLLGTLKVNIQNEVTKAQEIHQGHFKVTIGYDFENKRFVAPITHKKEQIAQAEATGEVLERGVKPVEIPDVPKLTPVRRTQIAKREAAKLVLGMLFMGSVPTHYTFDPLHEIAPEKIWSEPDPTLRIWEHKRNLILSFLGGVASDRIQLGGSLSPESRQDIMRLKVMLDDLNKEIHEDAKAQDFGAADARPENEVKEGTAAVVQISKTIDELLKEIKVLEKQKDKKPAKKEGEEANANADAETTDETSTQEEIETREQKIEKAKQTLAELEKEKTVTHTILGLDAVIPKKQQKEPIFQELIAGKTGAALARGISDVIRILDESPRIKGLYEAVAAKIESGSEVKPEDFRKLVEEAKLGKEVPREVTQYLAQTEPGTPVLQSCRAMMQHIGLTSQKERSILQKLWDGLYSGGCWLGNCMGGAQKKFN